MIMRRRDFLSLFLLSPVTALADDGLLLDSGVVSTGMLSDVPQENVSGMLLDVPPEAVSCQKRVVVHLYSPETWTCPYCDTAEKELRDHPGIELRVHKSDTLTGFFAGKSFPILHWAAGDGWQQGWTTKEQFLAKVLKDDSNPPVKKPQTTSGQIAVRDRGGSHWSVNGDWSPSRQKVVNHLVSTHGYQRSRVENLNLGQLLTLHDYAHEGRKSQSQVKTNSASCPTGTCPTQHRQTSQRSFLFWRW